MTQCHQPTTPGAETIQTESSTMNKLMVWFQRRAGLADGAVNFVRDTEKLMLLAMAGSQMEIGWFGVNFWTQTSTKIPLESSDQRFLIGAIKIWWFLCEIIR
jgi:hypothetical protein